MRRRLRNVSPSFFLVVEQFFSKLPYKREKKFPTQKYWSNRPILMLTFFYFDILKSADTFITDNWGDREDSQTVLVAICTLEYFSWLYTLIFFRCFSFFVSSGTSFVYTMKENTFFQSYYTNKGKLFWYWKLHFIRRIQVQQQTTNKRYLIFQSQYRLVAAFI